MAVIDAIVKRAEDIAAGRDPLVKGKEPSYISEAVTVGDRGYQGDLNFEIVDATKIPEGYYKVKKLSSKNLQLVPGNTEGARHCLGSLKGVTMYLPQVWDEETLQGPFVIFNEANEVQHPKHPWVIDQNGIGKHGLAVHFTYSRVLDRIKKQIRRNKD